MNSCWRCWQWVEFTFSTLPWVQAATPYWLLLSTSYSPSASDYVAWGVALDGSQWVAGELLAEGAGWSPLTQDACFQVLAA